MRAGPEFARADPVVRKAAVLAKSGVVPTKELARLLVSLKQTGGWDGLVKLIYNSTASLNGFDQYGHFGRTRLAPTQCVEYYAGPGGGSGCVARFNGTGAAELSMATSTVDLLRLLDEEAAARNGGTLAEAGPAIGIGQSDSTSSEAEAEEKGEGEVSEASKTGSGTEPLLDYLLGP